MKTLIDRIVERLIDWDKHSQDGLISIRGVITIIGQEAKDYEMEDLINRSEVLEWIEHQREDVTKKQVKGTEGSIFTREELVTMQRCISIFEKFIKNQPAYIHTKYT